MGSQIGTRPKHPLRQHFSRSKKKGDNREIFLTLEADELSIFHSEEGILFGEEKFLSADHTYSDHGDSAELDGDDRVDGAESGI